MTTPYGGTPNYSLLRFIGSVPERVLDVGCGRGSWAPLLRAAGAQELTGVDISPLACQAAEQNYDRVVHAEIGSLGSNDLGGRPFQLIVAADVLEHMVDPWASLEAIRSLGASDGILAVSVPNLRFYKLLGKLALGGDFSYSEDGGLMDVGHLRWFTRRTLQASLLKTGWKPFKWGGAMGRRRELLSTAIPLTSFREFIWHQVYVLARPS